MDTSINTDTNQDMDTKKRTNSPRAVPDKFDNPADRTSTRDVFAMSLPIFVELFLQMSVGYVDQILLANLGTQPAAAVGNAIQILNLVTIMLSAMATAATVLISRALGAGHRGHINVMTTVSFVANTCTALVITIGLFCLWPQLLDLLNVNADIYAMTANFLLIVASTTVLQGVYFALTSVLRAFARMKDIMVVNIVGNVLNILGCLILVNGVPALGIPALGVVGSAISWVIFRVFAVALAAFYFLRHTSARVRISTLRPFPVQTFKQMLIIGVPSSGEQFSYDLSQTVILAFVNLLGSAVVTVKVYCSMCASIAYTYSIAISQATQIVIGYLFGRKNIQPIFHRVFTAAGIAILISVSISVVLYLNSDAIFSLVTDDPFIHQLGRQILFVEIFLEVGRSLNIVMVRALIGVGDVKTPVTLNIICSWAIAVAGGYLLGIHLGMGLVGVWIAMCADEVIRGILLTGKFALGRWKRNVEQA